MPLDQLLAALEREARTEADRLLAEARADAARRTAVAEAAVSRRREESLGSRAREQQAELEAALSAARLAARREVLRARERLLERVFASLQAACAAAIASPAFAASLPGRVAAALACTDDADAVILSAPAPVVALLAAAGPAAPRVTVQPDPEAGSGFRLATADGSLEVTDTLESRIAALRPALARQALVALGLEA